VSDDGTGLVQLETPPHGAINAFEAVFTHLHTGPTRDGHHPHVHVRLGLQGVGLAVVSALSQRLEVRSIRSGLAWEAAFEAGRVITPVHATGLTDQRGTRIRYRPDPLIFKDAGHDLASLQPRLGLLGTLFLGSESTDA
jgi:DNA gyrase/topoisomerase IV subunit B